MFGQMTRDRSPECLSDLRFDAWLAGELGPDQQTALLAHAARCGRCGARKECLLRQREQFTAENPVPAWLAPPARTKGTQKRSAWILCSSVAAAACALLTLSVREAPRTRTKGGEHVTFYVKRGDEVQRGARERPLRPGDKLRFAYSSASPRYLAILSLDAAHRASVYYPAASRAAPIEPGVEVLLPSAVELDTTLGEERVFALFCDEAIAIAPLRAELEAKRLALRPPAGCAVYEVSFTKEAAVR